MSFDSRILRDPATGLVVDLSTAPGAEVDLGAALAAMAALEAGSIANPDEQRQVGHYWLRAPELAPAGSAEIERSLAQIHHLAKGAERDVLLIGIGGSALGPELVVDALAKSPERFHLLDSVDPDGIARTLRQVDPRQCTVLVASKSGTTVETRTALRAAEAHWAEARQIFADDAIAITTAGSPLAELGAGWQAVVPVWDWVGGRTSITSAVGLLPMALMGIDIEAFLGGARAMDVWTRQSSDNPAAGLAGAWLSAGQRSWVMLPYADRLRHLGRYLQQLVMESLGKSHTRSGAAIHHGRSVYGNRGSADQHALVQQLRDGPDDVFVHFIDVQAGPQPSPLLRDAADTQLSLLHGTRAALNSVGRPTAAITLPDLSPRSLGALIALFERGVGLYAELQDLNAYDQPGVEAGKRAARELITDLNRTQAALSDQPQSAEALSTKLEITPDIAWRLCRHLCATQRAHCTEGSSPSEDTFQRIA
jgi:glucose-6-phosphate isomerase